MPLPQRKVFHNLTTPVPFYQPGGTSVDVNKFITVFGLCTRAIRDDVSNRPEPYSIKGSGDIEVRLLGHTVSIRLHQATVDASRHYVLITGPRPSVREILPPEQSRVFRSIDLLDDYADQVLTSLEKRLEETEWYEWNRTGLVSANA